MKTTLAIIGLSAFLLLAFLGFSNGKETEIGRTEEYAMIVFTAGAIERNMNGKTDYFELEGEKVEGLPGKQTMSSLVRELNKMNEQGYQIVNVSASPVSGAPGREVYLFKRKPKK